MLFVLIGRRRRRRHVDVTTCATASTRTGSAPTSRIRELADAAASDRARPAISPRASRDAHPRRDREALHAAGRRAERRDRGLERPWARRRARRGRRRGARTGPRSRGVHRLVARPRPAAELRALVVGERLLDLRRRVHHERAVLHDRLADRAALQQQQLALVRRRASSAHVGVARAARTPRASRTTAPPTRQRAAAEEVERAVRAAASPAAASTRAPGAMLDRPDRDVGVGARGPRVRRRRGRRASPSAPAITVTSVVRPAASRATWRGIVVVPQHREVRLDHLVGARQVEPDLEQLERVRPARARAAGTSRSGRCPCPR